MAKKKVRKSKAKTSKSRVSSKINKLNMVWRRLLFFLVLFIIFVVLDAAVSSGLWSDFFGMGTLIFGFISAALFIVILILWFLKIMKK